MSLIQDALKREANEPPKDERNEAASETSEPIKTKADHSVTRAKIDEAVRKEEAVLSKPSGPSVISVILLVLILILVVAVVGYLTYYTYNELYNKGTTDPARTVIEERAVEDDGPTDFVEVTDAVETEEAVGQTSNAKQENSWPSLNVSGVFPAPDESQAGAIINSRFLPVGSSDSGVLLKAVTVDGVVLVYQKEEVFVGMGQTTADRRPSTPGASR